MIIEQYTDADDDIHSHIVLELDDVQPSLIHVVKTRINTVSKDFKDVLLVPSRSDIVWRKRARFDVDVDVDDRCFDNITYCLSDDSMYAAILVGNKLFGKFNFIQSPILSSPPAKRFLSTMLISILDYPTNLYSGGSRASRLMS